MTVRGVRFEPDTPSGPSWLQNYDWQRPQVLTELQALRVQTGLTHVVVTLAAGAQLSWPLPTAEQLSRLSQFINDAAAYGMSTILHAGGPMVVSQQEAAAKNFPHVGGALSGSVANNWQVWWDQPVVGEDHKDRAADWYQAIVEGLSSTARAAVEHLTIGGDCRVPFPTEVNLLWAPCPVRETVAEYLRQVIDRVHVMAPGLPVGPALNNSSWKTGVEVYEQAAYAAANIPQADVYESVAQWSKVDIATLRTHLPASKLVVTDMKTDLAASLGVSHYAMVSHFVSRVALLKLRGYWIWEYRRRNAGWLREREINGGAWEEKTCALLRVDAS